MGNEHRRRITNGDEELAHTDERHMVIMRRGESAGVKRATNRRERREGLEAVLTELVRDAEEHDLYRLTARPPATR